MGPFSDELLWLVVAGFVLAFVLAFGIGANDVANSFGTSVGSKVLTLTQACMLATVFEIAGAVLIGYKVSDTMRKGVLDVGLYAEGGERQLAAGCVAALGAGAAWLLLATAASLPVSGTHSIVGATVGFTLAAKGPVGIHWGTLGAIVASWFISPALAGGVSVMLCWLVRRLVLSSAKPVQAALRALPAFYAATIFVNVLSVVHDGPKLLHMDGVPVWTALAWAGAIAALAALAVQFLLVPYYRRRLVDPHQPPNKPAWFTLGASNDTTPVNTPTHVAHNGVQRPTSLISEDGKVLEAITEAAEMVTLSEVDKASLDIREMNLKNRPLLATMEDCSILSRSLSPPKHRLQLDCDSHLKYIDETMSYCKSIDSAQLAGMGESYDSRNGFLGSSCDTIARVDHTVISPCIDIGTPLHIEKSLPTMTPNSSAAPLIRATQGAGGAVDAAHLGTTASEELPEEPALRLFSFLQILTASFGAFAHGGNDVSNAIGPLVALWLLWEGGEVPAARAETPLLILLYGGAGISVGLWLWGRRVIRTVGSDLTNITPDTGFTIEVGAALTVLVASKVGLPVSTTHCKVGSVVCVGLLSSRGVDWTLFRNIIFAWVVTVPAVAGMAALLMCLFDWFIV